MNKTVPVVPHFPWTATFERNFNRKECTEWVKENHHHSLYYSLAYLVAIYVGRNLMRNREPFRLKWPLIIWNLVLAVFSICGTIRSGHALLYALNNFGFEHSLCDTRYIGNSVLSFWNFYFLMSKVVELFDTMYIILRKQNLIFLHWFHHCSVLIFSWVTAGGQMAMGRWFIVMNYAVHSFMYSYFMLRAMSVRLPRTFAMFVTSAQLLQMLVGFYVSMKGLVYYLTKKDCGIAGRQVALAVTIYSFYFVLFCNFFVRTYFLPGGSKAKGEKQK